MPTDNFPNSNTHSDTPSVPPNHPTSLSFRVGRAFGRPGSSCSNDPTFGAPTYTWDPATGTWKRSIGLAPFVTTDGGQVAPNNVIIQFVGSYLQSPEAGSFNTVGNGDAWVFSAGQVIKGKWSRTSRTTPTQFTDAKGAPIRLTPGRTWVEFDQGLAVFNGVDIVPGPPSPSTTTTTTKKKK